MLKKLEKNHDNPLAYIPSIDGLRGFLCLWVLLAHWDLKHFNSGWVAMGIFFLLSGFLIGRILKVSKVNNFKKYYTNYFINRVLRIFPLYYLSLLICFLLMYLMRNQSPKMAETWAFHTEHYGFFMAYGVNLIKLFDPAGHLAGHNFLGHYWSLAVEEQFYLLFPFLIFFIREKALKIVLILIIIGSPFFKYFSVVFLEPQGVSWARSITYELAIYWLDAFALGAALVFFDFSNIKNPKMLARIMLCITMLVGFSIYYVGQRNGYGFQIQNIGMDFQIFQNQLSGNWLIDYRFVIMGCLVNLTGAAILLCAILDKPFSKLLDNRYLIFVGRRSYAIYVFHLPLLIMLWHFKIVNLDKVFNNPLYNFCGFICYILVMVFIANLTYEYFEKKFFKYKRKYT